MSRDPAKRPTARDALQHPWLRGRVDERASGRPLDDQVVARLQRFAQSSVFKRTVLEAMAADLAAWGAAAGLRDAQAAATACSSGGSGARNAAAAEAAEAIAAAGLAGAVGRYCTLGSGSGARTTEPDLLGALHLTDDRADDKQVCLGLRELHL